MPRQTAQSFLDRHRFLADLWEAESPFWSNLEPNQQWIIHDYYRPSENLSREELLEHRNTVSHDNPSLPSRAGKIFNLGVERLGHQLALVEYLREHPTSRPRSKRRGRIHVYAVVRPKMDAKMFARAVIDLAEEQRKMVNEK